MRTFKISDGGCKLLIGVPVCREALEFGADKAAHSPALIVTPYDFCCAFNYSESCILITGSLDVCHGRGVDTQCVRVHPGSVTLRVVEDLYNILKFASTQTIRNIGQYAGVT